LKIKNIAKIQNQILKLKLITTKTNKKNTKHIKLNIENIVCRLKKGLHIIYKFQIQNKKILFFGNKNLQTIETKIKKLLQFTKHKFISEYL
jgi:hypothetical protein